MVRMFAFACTLVAVLFVVGESNDVQAQKAQMVKGTIKLVDSSKDLLVVKQKVKNETVDRELSILDTTEFVINGTSKSGAAGLKLLEDTKGAVGASVQVKCDKDVNVLKVTVKTK